MNRTTGVALACIMALTCGAQSAQARAPGATGPEQVHIDRAMALAGSSYMQVTARLQCAATGALPAAVRDATAPPATRIFDNFYFVGLAGVGAYALKTDAGVILIDALNSTADAQKVIEPGLRAVGLDPAAVKYVVVTHGHGDHYGGARYFAETYGAHVLMSEADWTLALNRPRPSGPDAPPFSPPPAKDLIATDGQTLRLGKVSLKFVLTPGHTPGTLSLIVPVTDHGRRHVLGMWGGTGLPRDPAALAQYIASARKFEAAAKRAGADAELSNHPFVDDSLRRMEALRSNPTAANPFVIGPKAYRDYSGVITECALAAQARAANGQK